MKQDHKTLANEAGEDADARPYTRPLRSPLRRISTRRDASLALQSHRVVLDESTRERIERLRQRIATGLDIDASVSVMVRVALKLLEDHLSEVLPRGAHGKLMLPDERATEAKCMVLMAARGGL